MKRGAKNTAEIKISLIIIAIAFLYAIIRYNVIRGISWEQLPLFISNKAIALAALALIALSYAIGSLSKFWPKFSSLLNARKYFGLFGFGLGAIHGLISLLIFDPQHYPKFFTDGVLNFAGELSMLFGVLALAIFAIVAISSIPSIAESLRQDQWLKIQRLGYLGLLLLAGHVFVMGYKGWLQPGTWPGGLLPISLVAFIIAAFVLLLKLMVVLFKKK